jgi:uncharacterized protein (TIGR02646 family)
MKYIKKAREPKSLIEHSSKEHACYDNIPKETKNEIRETLLSEQGHVCCYCMKRIHMEDMKIEHWKPQRYVELSMLYNNMLGACDGNEGKPKHLQCCDTYKGETELFINPLDMCCEALIQYRSDGTIYSDDHRVGRDLEDVLNLNQQTIKENRKKVIDGIVEYLQREYPEKKWTKANIRREINKWNQRNAEGKYIEYYGVALYRLQRLFSKTTS